MTTEEKIKQAATKVFITKGFAGTKTRDIAEEAGLNLALINYYFRSKQNLYNIVVMDIFSEFINGLRPLLDVEESSFEEKISEIVSAYTTTFLDKPEILLFILNEMHSALDKVRESLPLKEFPEDAFFFSQLKDGIERGEYIEILPIDLFLNILSCTLFPFMARPMLKALTKMDDETFRAHALKRKEEIPKWILSSIKKK